MKKLLSLLALGCVFCLSHTTSFADPIPDGCKTGGFAIGCQAWTFNQFTVLEAIDKTADAACGKVHRVFPWPEIQPRPAGCKIRPKRHRRI